MDTSLPISQLDPIGSGVYTGVGDLYSAYLGPLPQLQRTDSYQKRNVQTWDMPENYKGQNLYLRDTVEDLMFTANQTYLTTRILPFFATDQVNLQWEHFEANAHLLDLTPYQTTSHAVTSKRQVRRAQLVRRGISAEFENDFLRTPMGRTRFLSALGQIARSVQETANAEVIRALVTSHRFQQQFVREAGMPQDQLMKHFLEQDRERFAIAQKTKNGLEKLNLLINKEMSSYRGEADAFLIPEEISIFTTIVRPEKTDYYLAGQLGPDRVNGVSRGAMASGNTMGSLDRVEARHMIQDVPVYIVKNLQVENVTEAESQLLTRVRQIGEYVTMLDTCTDYSNYKTDHRSILMYNQDIDDMTKITLEDAINNSELFDNNNLRPVGYDRKDSAALRNDRDEDFLTYLRPAADGQTRRAAVEYVFDIAPEYLSAKKVVNGGESLKAAFISQYGSAAREALTAIDRQPRKIDSSWGGMSAKDKAKFELIGRFLNQVLGEDSLFSKFDVGGGLGNTGQNVYNFFVLRKKTAAVILNNSDDGAHEHIQSSVDTAFFQTLMSQVPASKRSEIQSIIDTHPGSTVQKGEQIRDKILQYVGDNVSGLKFKDEAPVHKWFGDRVKQYTDISSSSAATPAPAVAQGEIAGYMEPGQDLTGTGYKYLYTASARPSQSNLDTLMPFRMQMDAAVEDGNRAAAPVGSSLQQGGVGLGLAGIGAFDRNRGENRQKRRDANDITKRFKTLEVQLEALKKSGGSEFTKVFAMAYLMMRVTKSNLLSLCTNNVAQFMNFILFRPHMQYRTRAIVKCKQDGGSGITAIGNSNLGISSEVGRKVSQMHYTTHFRSVIVYPKNVYVQPDVYVQESEGGAGCRFFSRDSYAQLDLDHIDASLICCAVPITETHFPSPMDISGRFYTEYNLGLANQAQFERLHYSTAARYNGIYKFLRDARQGTDVPHLAPGRSHHNRICYQGHQQNYNPKSGEFNKIIVCKGHWTKNVAAGNGGIRNGALEVLETIDYSTRNAN